MGKFSRDFSRPMMSLEEPDPEDWLPNDPAKQTYVTQEVLKEQIKQYVRRREVYEDNLENAFSAVLGQYSVVMKVKLEGQHGWDATLEDNNLVELLKSIKVWILNQKSTRNPVAGIDASIHALYKLRQNRHESLVGYRKRFFAVTDVLKHTNVELGKSLTRLVRASSKSNGVLVKEKPRAAMPTQTPKPRSPPRHK